MLTYSFLFIFSQFELEKKKEKEKIGMSSDHAKKRKNSGDCGNRIHDPLYSYDREVSAFASG